MSTDGQPFGSHHTKLQKELGIWFGFWVLPLNLSPLAMDGTAMGMETDGMARDRTVTDRTAKEMEKDRAAMERMVTDQTLEDGTTVERMVADRSLADGTTVERTVMDQTAMVDRAVADRTGMDMTMDWTVMD